jgi:SAM-dependent methyltransferase
MTATTTADDFAGRLLQSGLGFFEVLSVYLGDKLGLYDALSPGSAMTSVGLADVASSNERYVREWLEQQAASGILECANPKARPTERRYTLPAAHAEVLTNRASLNYMTPVFQIMVSLAGPLPELLDAFRNGGGVSWARFGADAREGQGAVNRPIFQELLCQEWLPAVPAIDQRLKAQPPARVADVGCGLGWSSIALARGYPLVQVAGFDLDEPSIEAARRNLEGSGVEGRVRFHAVDVTAAGTPATYDLVTIFETLHDLSRPVEVLEGVRRLLAPAGAVLVVDEKVAPEFYAPADEIERLMYGWSLFCCLATANADPPSAGTGTVMRPAKLQEYATAAGFGPVETVELDHPFFRMYVLRPA